MAANVKQVPSREYLEVARGISTRVERAAMLAKSVEELRSGAAHDAAVGVRREVGTVEMFARSTGLSTEEIEVGLDRLKRAYDAKVRHNERKHVA
jgi:hypothetical protein